MPCSQSPELTNEEEEEGEERGGEGEGEEKAISFEEQVMEIEDELSEVEERLMDVSIHLTIFQVLNCMQELFLGKEKVSLLERCPHFRGVLRERFQNDIIV